MLIDVMSWRNQCGRPTTQCLASCHTTAKPKPRRRLVTCHMSLITDHGDRHLSGPPVFVLRTRSTRGLDLGSSTSIRHGFMVVLGDAVGATPVIGVAVATGAGETATGVCAWFVSALLVFRFGGVRDRKST